MIANTFVSRHQKPFDVQSKVLSYLYLIAYLFLSFRVVIGQPIVNSIGL